MTRLTIRTEALRASLRIKPCDEQWSIVVAEWPEEIPLTEETVARAVELGLDLVWLGKYLPEPARAKYERVRETAWAEHERVVALAWAEYERVRAPARAEYDRVRELAWAENDRVRETARAKYERVIALAWAEHERVVALAWAEYDRVRALAWAEYERARNAALLDALRVLAREARVSPSQHVALAGVAFSGAVLAAVYWRHPALWCAWVQAWTRREPEPSPMARETPETIATKIVAHAQRTGVCRAQGWVVTHKNGVFTVSGEGRIPTTHQRRYQAEARIVREWG